MDVSLKESHPQKYYIKLICSVIYFLGMGDIWYEDMVISYSPKMAYKIWAIISNGYVFIVLLNQFLAYTKSDLSEKEQNDLFQFSFGHATLCLKALVLYLHKDSITLVLKSLLETTRSTYFVLELEKKTKKEFIKYCIPSVVISFSTMLSATIGVITAYFRTGIAMTSEVVYYPSSSDSGIIAAICRFLVEFHWYWIVCIMLVLDCITLCCLIVLGYKFKTVQIFFDEIGCRIERNSLKSRKMLEEAFIKEFVVGMAIHKDAISCASKVQTSLGPLYGIQIFESVYLIVLCLVKFASGERTLIFLLVNMGYISAVLVITGSYMMAAGNITHEASLVPSSIFHCGWEKYTFSPKFRTLAVVALQCAQLPVVMTAYGVIPLSYSSLISILRASYSFFTVVDLQHQS